MRKMLRLRLKDADAFEEFFFGTNMNKGLIYSNIYASIQKGIFNKQELVQFAQITFESGDEVILDCHKDDFVENLSNCLNYYIEEEDYERCAQIQKLIKLTNG